MACCNIMSMFIKVEYQLSIFSKFFRGGHIHVNNYIVGCTSLTLMDSYSRGRYQWKLSSDCSTITCNCFSVLCKYWCPCITNFNCVIVFVLLTLQLSNIFKLNPKRTWYSITFSEKGDQRMSRSQFFTS